MHAHVCGWLMGGWLGVGERCVRACHTRAYTARTLNAAEEERANLLQLDIARAHGCVFVLLHMGVRMHTHSAFAVHVHVHTWVPARLQSNPRGRGTPGARAARDATSRLGGACRTRLRASGPPAQRREQQAVWACGHHLCSVAVAWPNTTKAQRCLSPLATTLCIQLYLWRSTCGDIAIR